jgi:hypothetical protein
LQEGPLLCVSFTDYLRSYPKDPFADGTKGEAGVGLQLTEESIGSLRAAGLPEAALRRLELMRREEIKGRADADSLITSYLEARDAERYRQPIHDALVPLRPRGLVVRDAAGKERRVFGMFAALSFDEGKTWPVKKLVTPGGQPRLMRCFGWVGDCRVDETHAEIGGYLANTQTPDGVIHLISSGLHYRFNLAWLKEPMLAEK